MKKRKKEEVSFPIELPVPPQLVQDILRQMPGVMLEPGHQPITPMGRYLDNAAPNDGEFRRKFALECACGMFVHSQGRMGYEDIIGLARDMERYLRGD